MKNKKNELIVAYYHNYMSTLVKALQINEEIIDNMSKKWKIKTVRNYNIKSPDFEEYLSEARSIYGSAVRYASPGLTVVVLFVINKTFGAIPTVIMPLTNFAKKYSDEELKVMDNFFMITNAVNNVCESPVMCCSDHRQHPIGSFLERPNMYPTHPVNNIIFINNDALREYTAIRKHLCEILEKEWEEQRVPSSSSSDEE